MKKLSVAVVAGLMLVLGVFIYNSVKEEPTTENVMGEVMENFDVQGYIIQGEEGVIDVDVYNEDDVKTVKMFIEKNMPAEDLEKYYINVVSGWDVD